MEIKTIKRMKSIKEKIRSDYPKSNILEEELSRVGYRVVFEKGANYVLEKICEIIDNNSSCEKVILEIGKLIIQLKK